MRNSPQLLSKLLITPEQRGNIELPLVALWVLVIAAITSATGIVFFGPIIGIGAMLYIVANIAERADQEEAKADMLLTLKAIWTTSPRRGHYWFLFSLLWGVGLTSCGITLGALIMALATGAYLTFGWKFIDSKF